MMKLRFSLHHVNLGQVEPLHHLFCFFLFLGLVDYSWGGSLNLGKPMTRTAEDMAFYCAAAEGLRKKNLE